jgi:Ca-activated chloride channel homolog
MSFAAPYFLLSLLLIPLVAGAFWLGRRRRRRMAVRFPGAAVFASAAGGRSTVRRVIPPALLAAAAAALAIGFAAPEATVAVPVEKASVVLITDESGSMAATDVDPSRLSAAQSAAGTFLDRIPEELLVGFVAYSSQTNTVLEPTSDHDRVGEELESLRAEGGTATGDALNAALDRLSARRGDDGKRAPAAVVLLSDGKTTTGRDPLAVARRAKRLGIPVSTVALGTDEGTVTGPLGEVIPVPPDPETLQAISDITGGTFTEADDAGELDSVYENLGSKIGTKDVKRQVSAGFSLAGLLLLLAGLATGVKWRGRLP